MYLLIYKKKRFYMYSYYQSIPGWFDFEDIYQEAIDRAPKNGHLVEIGTFLGKSLCYLLEKAEISQKNLSISCVDLFSITPDSGDGEMPWGENARIWEKNNGGENALFDHFQKNISECAGNKNLSILRQNSWEASHRFENSSLDFVFIDASHAYHNVKKDIESWFPKLKPGSIMAGHDYNRGVEKAVREFFEQRKLEIYRRNISWLVYT